MKRLTKEVDVTKHHTIGKMHYEDIDGDMWEYEMHTTPPEALYWKTYKVKLMDIKIVSDVPTHVKNRVRKEILKDIQLSDVNVFKPGRHRQ